MIMGQGPSKGKTFQRPHVYIQENRTPISKNPYGDHLFTIRCK